MALRLTVDRQRFRAHVTAVAASMPNLVPVVKGNGYGLGRRTLVAQVGELLPATTTVAVGTIHEAHDVAAPLAVHVMNPIGSADAGVHLPTNAIPTVASLRDVEVLERRSWKGRVVVKLASSMRRFGATPDEFPALVQAVSRLGGVVHACSIHPPTAGTDDERLAEIDAWLPLLPDCVTLSVSHLSPVSLAALRARDEKRTIEARLGTALWHGDKSHFALHAEVLATHRCNAGEVAGYRKVGLTSDGTVVVVSAGSSHGVTPLPDGRSPFHFAQRRLDLVEPPHMHTSLVFAPVGQSCPSVGDMVDVQRPLTMVQPDIVDWA